MHAPRHPQVAACVALFSLDKHGAIPVDTHVWQLATRYYAPHLKSKSLTPKIMPEVRQQQGFSEGFEGRVSTGGVQAAGFHSEGFKE